MSNGFDKEAFVARIRLWETLRAELERALGPDGAARWLECAARQVRREAKAPSLAGANIKAMIKEGVF